MSYSTLIDMKNSIPGEYIKMCSDDADSDDINEEKVDDCIRRADDMIDGYLRGRYTVPIVDIVPDMIRDISTKLAIYFLFKRSLILTLPEPIKEDHDWAMKTLSGIQRGQISPFPEVQNPTWVVSNQTGVVRDTTKLVSTTSYGSDWDRYTI